MNLLNIHAILSGTTVNGPGSRTAIWTQGCGKACKGCFNPETWNNITRTLYDPQELAQKVMAIGDEGLTITGGDPLEQPEALLEFLKALHDEEGSLKAFPRGIICFTGYTLSELESIPQAWQCLRYIDLLIDGRYVEALRYTSGLAGSSNQNFTFHTGEARGKALIPEEAVTTDQGVEVFGGENNEVEVTGFPTIDRKWLTKVGLKVIP